MKNILVSALVLFSPAAAFSSQVEHIGSSYDGYDNYDSYELDSARGALMRAQDLVQELQDLNFGAQQVGEQAARAGNTIRAQRFGEIARSSRELAQGVRQQIIQPLRRGAPEHAVARNLQLLRSDLARLQQAERAVISMPPRLAQNFDQVRYLLQELQQELRSGGGHHPGPIGPGPGPRPGHGLWVGSCDVALETIFGRDVRTFTGIAEGRTQQEAVALAQNEGIAQCQVHITGGLKCTVNHGRCTATRAGGRF